MGLTGMCTLTDPLNESLPLPKGAYDVPLIVSDKMFNNDGSLLSTPATGRAPTPGRWTTARSWR